MTTTPPSPALRLARLLRPGRNPLGRGADRVEATFVVLSVLLALVLVPVMLTFGSLTYASLAEQNAQRFGDRYETVAILTEDAPNTGGNARGEGAGGRSEVPARWQLRNGATRTGLVQANDGTKAGTEVSVWLDESGRPVKPPLSTVDLVGAGVLVAVFGWLGAVGLLALGCWGLHHVLDRRRHRAWDDEWARVEPDWHDRRR